MKAKEDTLSKEFNEINTKTCILRTKVTNIIAHSEHLKSERKDMKIQCTAMETKIVTSTLSLKNLQELVDKKLVEVAREEALNSELEHQVKTTEERISSRKASNADLLMNRKLHFKRVMNKLEAEIDRNKQLAKVYKTCQAFNLASKQAVLKINEKRTRIEANVQEQQKIVNLQNENNRRLHTVLVLQKQANAARQIYLQQTQKENQQALSVIKHDLLSATKEVGDFMSHEYFTKKLI